MASGIWWDVNASDSVSLSATLGKVNKSGTSESGTWDWSFDAIDDLEEDVTITANDEFAD